MGGAIKSEIRKIFTTRMWWGMAAGMALLAFLLSMGLAALVGQEHGFAKNANAAQLVYSAGLFGGFGSLSALFPLALGVLLITNEFRHKTVSSTYLSTPRRATVAISKTVAVLAVGLVYGILHVIASVAGGALILGPVKHTSLFLGNSDVLTTFLMSIVAVVVWTLIGFGFGMLVRNQIAAVLVAVGFAFLGQIILNIIFGILGWDTAAKFIPGNLTTGMLVTGDPSQTPGTDQNSPYFGPWASVGLLVLYTVVIAGVGSWLTARRDIT
ncbi:ABC transporter permease [Calidifontibacter terrae]